MKFKVQNYSCTIDAELYGIKASGSQIFSVFWEGAVGNPNDPDLWSSQKKALIKAIEQLLEDNETPLVTVFAPKRKDK